MRYSIQKEKNGLGQICYIPMYGQNQQWNAFLDAQRKEKRFNTISAAQAFIDSQYRKHLASTFEVLENIPYIPNKGTSNATGN